MPGDNGQPAPEPRILITFPGVGLADATIRGEHVTPGQIQAAAWLLDQWARELRAVQLATSPSLLIPQVRGLPGTKVR